MMFCGFLTHVIIFEESISATHSLKTLLNELENDESSSDKWNNYLSVCFPHLSGFTIRLLATENNYLTQKAVKGLSLFSLSGFVRELCFISAYKMRGEARKAKQFPPTT